jgi:hypothetical protein
MINKKNVLGQHPYELGTKDAVHVAIVAVRAACPIAPGQRCGLNNDQEAIPDGDGPGIADPFRAKTIMTGDSFWLVLNQDAVPNVQHVWDHPTIDFSAPTKPARRDPVIQMWADKFQITYESIMERAQECVDEWKPVEYRGTLVGDDLEAAKQEFGNNEWEFWSSWNDEMGGDALPNEGSVCCPELTFPSRLFR